VYSRRRRRALVERSSSRRRALVDPSSSRRRALVDPSSSRRRAVVDPSSSPRRALVEPSSSPRRALVEPSSSRRRAVVEPSSSRRRAVVEPSSIRRRAVVDPSVCAATHRDPRGGTTVQDTNATGQAQTSRQASKRGPQIARTSSGARHPGGAQPAKIGRTTKGSNEPRSDDRAAGDVGRSSR
jgi:hypothetical protein